MREEGIVAELLDMLGGSVVTREAHEARVSELLAANNRELERGRDAREFVRHVATMTQVEVEFFTENDARELQQEAGNIVEKWGEPPFWRPKYSTAEREAAIAIAARALRLNDQTAGELVDQIAEALGMERV